MTDDESDRADRETTNTEHDETTDGTPTRSMTETTPDAPETETVQSTTGGEERESRSSSSRLDRLSPDNLRGLLDRVGLAALVLLALIAGWSFYSQTGRAIRMWLDPAYQPIALAVFNLAVLLVALAGVAHQLYRIRRSEHTEESGSETAPSGE